MSEGTPIQNFYRGSSILLTGATGFLGMALLEKLIRCCPGIDKFYILLRTKKGKTEETRCKELFNNLAFQNLFKESLNFMDKIVIVPGDCALPDLGLTPELRKNLVDNVDIIIHSAATVRFDENLKTTLNINTNSTISLLNLASEIKNFKAFVYISTAYSFCNTSYISEEIGSPPTSYHRILKMAELLTHEEMEKLTPKLLEGWPNSYTLSKAISENKIKEFEGKFPISIFRPAIVVSSLKDPLPGWNSNLNGPNGIVTGVAVGLIRVAFVDTYIEANIVPVDLVNNGIIASAHEAHKLYSEGLTRIKIYNFESANDNKITWQQYVNDIDVRGRKSPPEKMLKMPAATYTGNAIIFWVSTLLFHYIPALFLDAGMMLVGKKPMFIKIYNKILRENLLVTHFSLKSIKFRNDNVRTLIANCSPTDKNLFNADVRTINWSKYFDDYYCGIRTVILKDPMTTVPAAIAKYKRLLWIHYFLNGLAISFLFYVIYTVLALFSLVP